MISLVEKKVNYYEFGHTIIEHRTPVKINYMYNLSSMYALYALFTAFNILLVCEWLRRKLEKQFGKNFDVTTFILQASKVTIILTLIMMLYTPQTKTLETTEWPINTTINIFNGSILLMVIGLLMLFTIGHKLKASRLSRYEIILILLIFILVNALTVTYNDLLALFVMLEISSLISFTLATFYSRTGESWVTRLNMLRASESSLKYFIVNSLASVLFLIWSSVSCCDLQSN